MNNYGRQMLLKVILNHKKRRLKKRKHKHKINKNKDIYHPAEMFNTMKICTVIMMNNNY